MALAERAYSQGPSDYRQRFSYRPVRQWSVTTWLIVINVAVFLVDQMTDGTLTRYGLFSADTAIFHLQIWRFISSEFLHAGIKHLFFNMFSLYFFGPVLESYLGRAKFLVFYLLCGIGGALGYLLLLGAHVLHDGPYTGLIGASGAIMGVLIGVAVTAPNLSVMLIIPPIPMRMRTMAAIFLFIAVLWIVFAGPNAGGEAAHLGGAGTGYLLIKNIRWLDWLDPQRWKRRRSQFWKPGDPADRFFRR